MITDATFAFPVGADPTPGTATATTSIYDAGSAKILFGGATAKLRMTGHFALNANGGQNPTVRLQFVGSNASDLDPNVNSATGGNVILADTGTLTHNQKTGVLFAGGTVSTFDVSIPVRAQHQACQYYGVIITTTGTGAVNPAFTSYIVEASQTNQLV